jgi:DNA repair exonuclease SbcCD ATPase subunit
VNEKNCEVQIEFDLNGKEYKVIRGIKPNIFEIYCDKVLINQDSTSKDYQEHLEKFILKMNYKSFTQIVILGSASFTPFMQLSSADRRAVIEDLLDIQIFSTMNIIAKQKFVENRSSIERNKIALNSKEDLKVYIEKNINSLKKTNNDRKNLLIEQKVMQEKEIVNLQSQIESLENKHEAIIQSATQKSSSKKNHVKYRDLQTEIQSNLQRHLKDKGFFQNHDQCPTCRQSIDKLFKEKIITESSNRIGQLEEGIEALNKKIDECLIDINEMNDLLVEANDIKTGISIRTAQISSFSTLVKNLQEEIDRIQNADNTLMNNLSELEQVQQEIKVLNNEKSRLLDERLLTETALTLLKDGGIKTKIIKQYLPIINKLINKYLAKMGFFVNFNINEQFEETIKSRHRDEFSYQNFSEGEKTRIDLALLFCWRSIAKMRNSVNTNLLLLDEVLDGSLDNNGTDEFLKIMWDMLGDTNTFVISHKTDAMLDKFEKIHKFKKIQNFSSLSQ